MTELCSPQAPQTAREVHRPRKIHWLKPSLWILGIALLTTVIWSFGLWAYNSYRLLSDDPSVWRSSINALVAEDELRALDPTKVNLVFLGSSSIRLFENLDSFFPEVNLIRKGFGGAKINDLRHYSEELVYHFQPEVVVLYVGLNDFLYRARKDYSKIPNDLNRYLDEMTLQLTHSKIVLVELRPMKQPDLNSEVIKFNQLLHEYSATTPQVSVISTNDAMVNEKGFVSANYLHWDGLHLSKAGYQMWGASLREKLLKSNLIWSKAL